jgi:RepB DNA-primase from phage plasmid
LDAHVCAFEEAPESLEKLGLSHLWAGNKFSRWSACSRAESFPVMNTFFAISLFEDDPLGVARRQKGLFRSTHCIVVDDVGTKVKPARVEQLLPPPFWKLETSPGNYQWGWKIKPETRREVVEACLRGLVDQKIAEDGRDPGMLGVTRYARLPVGTNTKLKNRTASNPDGFEHRLEYWAPRDPAVCDSLEDPGTDNPGLYDTHWVRP